MTTIFLSQRLMRGPDDTQINDDFRTLAYQARRISVGLEADANVRQGWVASLLG